MEGKLDKLFKDKLAQHKVNPSDRAWDQINQQLASKKRGIWAKRLAVAASLLVLISAVSIGYFYIERIKTDIPTVTESKTVENPEIKTKSEDEIKTPLSKRSESSEMIIDRLKQTVEPRNNGIVENTNDKSIVVAKQAEPIQNEEKAQTLVEKDLIIPVELNPEIEESQQLIAEITSIEDIKPAEDNKNLKSKDEPGSSEEPVSEKTYPKIRIVYKADENSELVASSNKRLIDKGIKRITEFSDEHIITDQVKTKLRNTKDDLLALNFGRILNKSNNQIDN